VDDDEDRRQTTGICFAEDRHRGEGRRLSGVGEGGS
jgi:hypothetical protein